MHLDQPSNANHSNRPKDTNPFGFGAGNQNDQKAMKVREYQEELERQVREKQLKKQKEKQEQDKLDKKMLLETAIYNPFGRSGGGAPIKDKDGNTVADLSQVRSDPLQYSPRDLPPSQSVINNLLNAGPNRTNSNDFLNNPGLNANKKTSSNDEQSFARGGHGIFGEGKSDEKKKKEDKYKAELQQQIEEKQRQKALEKERQRIEDEKEQKRIEEELKKIQAEVEEEERKKRQKEENDRNQAENAKKIAEENRKQLNNNKRVPNKPVNKRAARKPSSNDEPNSNDSPPVIQPEFRTNSPPVPAAAKKLNGGKLPPKKNIVSEKTNDNLNDLDRNFTPPPPKPVANNKSKQKSSTTADYYITESRLNVSSPVS